MREWTIWIEFPTMILTEEDVWPDGDGPENPMAKDVAEVMRAYGTRGRVLKDWFPLNLETVDIGISNKEGFASV